jgi:nucleotide-binding universal stress UspA family protein
MNETRIVVGADGSAGSAAAVRWAAAEARRCNAELRVLTAYHRYHPGQHVASGPGRLHAEDGATAVMLAAVAQAREVAPDLDVRGLALPGYAVPVLLHAAEAAILLVVGDRGKGGFPGLPFGSVSSQVATHARGSVVVVRGRSGADAGPVVVGVDGGPATGTIIGRAFAQAAMGGAAVVAVTVQSGGRPAAGPGPAGSSVAEAVLGSDIDGDLDPWRAKYPRVTAAREVVDGRPDKVLIQRSRDARLVVVGPRRHGFEGVLLGSVGTRLLQRADCPVLIARS